MILTLDVGFRNTGWAVMDRGRPIETGVIRTKKTAIRTVKQADDLARRSGEIATALQGVIERFHVKAIIGELPTGGGQSADAIKQMAMSIAVVSSVAALLKLPCDWCSPADVKEAATGDPGAEKEKVMAAIRELFPAAPFPQAKGEFEHIADAIGAYLAMRERPIVRAYGRAARRRSFFWPR